MPSQSIFHLEKYVAICESTNTYIKDNIVPDNITNNILLRSGYQLKGVGQGGSFWESEKDKNLLISFIIHIEELPAVKQFYFSKWIAVSLYNLLTEYVNKESLWIKWPNDIYFEDRKIAGILIENTVLGDLVQKSIVGIGLNVNQTNFTSDAPNPISLSQILNKEVSIDEVYNKLKNNLNKISNFKDSNFLNYIDKIYLERMYWKDEKHLFRIGNREEDAIILGTDDYGFLKLLVGNNIQVFDIKEVKYIK
jgi:BirA family biotin operon repressor/biotin-[acetyl-CoA-carboxylase] ligase